MSRDSIETHQEGRPGIFCHRFTQEYSYIVFLPTDIFLLPLSLFSLLTLIKHFLTLCSVLRFSYKDGAPKLPAWLNP